MKFPWLMSRPIAHRGLHDRAGGIIENTVPAALKAVEHHYGIECDVQLSSDGEAMIYHDFNLERLTRGTGLLANHTSQQLQAIEFQHGQGKIVPLAEFLGQIAGRVPLICEIKSRFDGDMRLTERTLQVALAQSGPIALKSFDPAIIAHLRKMGVSLPLGIIAEAEFSAANWPGIDEMRLVELRNFLHFPYTKPDFLSWNINNFPHPTPFLLQKGLGVPVMSWTVRTNEQRALCSQWADQMVFEGFLP
ncbi:MAG: glycerophosphodiester phosphodiesterase [Hyphomicrobiales bacterium]|nr:glycerophosphodiester phosphodiesterase [Hyphomicrobiales bacterium]MDE2114890.1 glycerophosphodiester phosphodiesterase [Hyphomicrobiales bacterium]